MDSPPFYNLVNEIYYAVEQSVVRTPVFLQFLCATLTVYNYADWAIPLHLRRGYMLIIPR